MIIVMIALMLLVTISLALYTYHFVKRLFNLLNIKFKYQNIVYIVICLLVMLLGVNIFNVSAIIILHWFVFGLSVDLIFYLVKKITKKEFIKIKDSGIIPIFLTLLVLCYGYYNMTHVINHQYNVVTEKELKQDYKVLFISDLHFKTTMSHNKLEKIVQDINALDYDFAILGGDIVDENTSKEDMLFCFKVLGQIKTKYGIYFIYGNHDKQLYSRHKMFDGKELEDAITSNGITILRDNYETINDDIILLGRNDISIDMHRLDTNKMAKEFDQDKFWLVVDHQPLDITYNAKLGYDLQISGHTHAGQIFPANQIIELFINEVSYGHEERDDYDIIVTAGMGGWAFPIRTSAHSEYLTINITNNEK